MPVLNNDTLDDPLVFDVVSPSSNGQQSFRRAVDIPVDAAALLVNCDIHRPGFLVTRPGATRIGSAAPTGAPIQALGYCATPAGDYLLAVAGGQAFKYSSGGSWSSALAGYSAGSSNLYSAIVQGLDRLYLANGSHKITSYNGVAFTEISGAPRAKFVIYHTSRLFGAGDSTAPDTLFVSDFLDDATWPTQNQVVIGRGEGAPLTGLVAGDEYYIFAFKRAAIYAIAAHPQIEPSEWTVQAISRRIGCVSHRTICQVGTDFVFLADDGVRTVGRTVATEQREVSAPLSEPITDLVRRIHWPAVDRACAVYHDRRYMLSVPIDGSQTPNAVFVYDTDRAAWAGYWTGWNATSVCQTLFGNSPAIAIGTSSGKVLRYSGAEDASSHTDDGVAYETRIVSRGLLFNEAVSRKRPNHLEIEWFDSYAPADVLLSVDAGSPQALALGVKTGEPPVMLPVDLPFQFPESTHVRTSLDLMSFPPFREAQLAIYAPQGGKLGFRAAIVSAFIDTLNFSNG